MNLMFNSTYNMQDVVVQLDPEQPQWLVIPDNTFPVLDPGLSSSSSIVLLFLFVCFVLFFY